MTEQEIRDNAPKGAVEYRSNGFYYDAQGRYWCNVNKQFFESLNWNNFRVIVSIKPL